ncbi:hypothetical protein NVP1262O_56 [Vibrio phage 1.262.O._10N.286.51.A9]|nr:hypothetical protein NVP1262O_56 [Vibrio phage 1.262.O._10N.286.51.A9]
MSSYNSTVVCIEYDVDNSGEILTESYIVSTHTTLAGAMKERDELIEKYGNRDRTYVASQDFNTNNRVVI